MPVGLILPFVCRDCGQIVLTAANRGKRGRCLDCAIDAMATYDREMAAGTHPDAFLSDAFGRRGGRPPQHRRK